MNDNIVEEKKCVQCGGWYNILEEDRDFYKKISPSFGWNTFEIPFPKMCPDCRTQRRLAVRNERNLYTRKCDKTWENIISIYSPDKSCIVYNQSYWWSDEFDGVDFGIEYDNSTPFFENFKKLDLLVPKLSTTIQSSENCDYTNDTGDSSDCYMSYRTHYSKNIMHSYRANKSSDCIDSYQVKESENLYECFQCNKCQKSKYLYNEFKIIKMMNLAILQFDLFLSN